MSTTQTAAATGGAAIAAPAPVAGRYNRSLVGDTWRRFRRHKLAVVGAFVYLSLIAADARRPADLADADQRHRLLGLELVLARRIRWDRRPRP